MVDIRKAWCVTWKKVSDIICIVSETTRERARRSCMLQIQDAGWKPKWVDIKAVREPKYDGWARRTRWRCVSEEFVNDELVAMDTQLLSGG